MKPISLSWLDIIIFATFILGIIALGLFAAMKAVATKRDYFLAGDKLPWWMIGGSIVAANISSHHFVGVMGVAYSRGAIAMVGEWNAILIGFNALLWIFLPFYLRNGFYTMPEFLVRRFGSSARTLYAGLILLTYSFVEISGVLYLGAVALKSLFGIPMLWSIVTLAIMTGLYTVLGGLRAVVWTEMAQLVVLLAGGITLSVKALMYVHGWGNFIAKSPKWDLILPANDPAFPWTMYLGGSLCISIFYCAANQFIVQRTLAAKDEWNARMGIVFTDYLKFLTPLIIIVPGLVAPLIFPHLEKPDFAFPALVGKLLPSGLIGLVMAGLIAAIMSHISGALNSCTTIATLDFYIPYVNKNATEAQAVRVGKMVGIGVSILGVIWAGTMIAHSKLPVFLYLLNAYGYFTPGIATMFLLGIFWKRTTQAGALAAGALTIPLTLIIEMVSPHLPHSWGQYVIPFQNRTGIVFWICMLVCVIVSLCTKPKPEEEVRGLIWNKGSLSLPKEQRAQMRGLRNPAIWWVIITAVVIFMFIRFH